MKNILFTLFMFFSVITFSQEICDNGIDDDADGLIDLQDTTDCFCVFNGDTIDKNVVLTSLIPNPSFEARTCCPSSLAQLNCAVSWIKASASTSDYFNNCGISSYTFGNPPPLPTYGNGYVGYIDGSRYSSSKEYIGSCLLDTLHAGTSYTIKYSMAFSSGVKIIPVAIFGNSDCSRLPFTTSKCPVNSTTPGWIILDSTIVTLDTTRWNTVIMSFVPTADLTAIAIGPACVAAPLPSLGYPYNTYYLDNVVLNTSNYFKKPKVFISDTGHYCSEDIVLEINFDSIPNYVQWYKDGIALLNDTVFTYSVPANTTGNYSVRLFYDSGCITTKPFKVDSSYVEFDLFSFGSCLVPLSTGKVFVKNIKSDSSTYLIKINGGSFLSDSIYTALSPGPYTVVVRDGNTCEQSKTIQVDTFPQPLANFRTDSICLGEATTLSDLSSISSGSITEWNWGIPISTTTQHSVYTFSSDGSFPINLTVKSDSGCIHDTMIPVIVHPLPVPNFTFSPTEIFTFDTRVCFSNTSSGVVSYSWDFDFAGTNGSSNLVNPCTVTFPNDKSATYTVKLNAVSEYGCKDSVEYNLVILDGLFLFIPNSFSPNNDGINDEFSISSEGLEELELIIFNRWGEVIFKTNDLEFSWDGKYKGTQVPIDSYPYSVRVKTNRGYVSKKQGHINVIR